MKFANNDVDILNLIAIEWLESHGNSAPTEVEIHSVEIWLKEKLLTNFCIGPITIH